HQLTATQKCHPSRGGSPSPQVEQDVSAAEPTPYSTSIILTGVLLASLRPRPLHVCPTPGRRYWPPKMARAQATYAQHGNAQLRISVAWSRTACGMVRPIAWAALRLITNSASVAGTTGSSSGWAPRRILST